MRQSERRLSFNLKVGRASRLTSLFGAGGTHCPTFAAGTRQRPARTTSVVPVISDSAPNATCAVAISADLPVHIVAAPRRIWPGNDGGRGAAGQARPNPTPTRELPAPPSDGPSARRFEAP